MKGRKDVEAKESERAGNLRGAQKTAPGPVFRALHWRIQTSGSEHHLHRSLSNNSRQCLIWLLPGWEKGHWGLGVQTTGVEGIFLPFSPYWQIEKKKKICKYTADHSLSFLGETIDSFRLSLGGIRIQHTRTVSSILAICNRYRIWPFHRCGFTPHPISPKSDICTNLGGSARAGIYIQVPLGTRQKLRTCFPFDCFLNSFTEVESTYQKLYPS